VLVFFCHNRLLEIVSVVDFVCSQWSSSPLGASFSDRLSNNQV